MAALQPTNALGLGVGSVRELYIRRAGKALVQALNDGGRLGAVTRAMLDLQYSMAQKVPADQLRKQCQFYITNLKQLTLLKKPGLELTHKGASYVTHHPPRPHRPPKQPPQHERRPRPPLAVHRTTSRIHQRLPQAHDAGRHPSDRHQYPTQHSVGQTSDTATPVGSQQTHACPPRQHPSTSHTTQQCAPPGCNTTRPAQCADSHRPHRPEQRPTSSGLWARCTASSSGELRQRPQRPRPVPQRLPPPMAPRQPPPSRSRTRASNLRSEPQRDSSCIDAQSPPPHVTLRVAAPHPPPHLRPSRGTPQLTRSLLHTAHTYQLPHPA